MNNYMKVFLLSCSFLSSTNADFKKVEIKNFKAKYTNPKGSGSAERFSLITDSSPPYRFGLTREGINYRLSYEGGEYLFEELPSFFKGLEKLDINRLSFQAKSRELIGSLKSFKGSHFKGSSILKNFEIQCFYAKNFELEGDKYLDACLTNSEMGLKMYQSSAPMQKGILKGIAGAVGIKSNKGSSTSIENADLTINDNQFVFSGKIDAGLAAKVKVNGQVNYQKSSNRVRLRIKKVKTGFINITGTVFKELKKLETDNFRVNRPFIDIYLNQ